MFRYCAAIYAHPLIRDWYQKRITGGRTATPHSWPSYVGIWMSDSYYCGGTLLDELVVLTAAHCFKDADGVLQPADMFSVMIGICFVLLYFRPCILARMFRHLKLQGFRFKK